MREFVLDPAALGLPRASVDDLVGGDAQQNAKVARAVLGSDDWDASLTAARDIVLLNAAGGVVAYRMAKDSSQASRDLNERFGEALEQVRAALESGAAAEKPSAWRSAA